MTNSLRLSHPRNAALLDELRFALQRTSRDDLEQWGLRSSRVLAAVTVRRARNFGAVATRLGGVLVEEGAALLQAIRRGSGLQHVSSRAAAAADAAKTLGSGFDRWYRTIHGGLRSDPQATGSRLAALVLGFLAGSGGTDGDGGVPDLDLLGGIDAHRSILTHSVLAGIVLETLILSFLDLARTVYANLPDEHDELWNRWNAAGDDVFGALSAGLSMGIAYHLGVDATVDGGGTFKDLPVSLPLEAHQGILAASSAVEAVDAGARLGEERGEEIEDTLFRTFRDASTFAKRNPGYVIVRATDAEGFRVMRKVPRTRRRRAR